MSDAVTGKYSIVSFHKSRIFTMDIGVLGAKKHHLKALVEFDVTDALDKIEACKSSDPAFGVS
ncbi:MAG: hypothetical protein ACRCUT_11015, partial [Spirochaetota bacterium]